MGLNPIGYGSKHPRQTNRIIDRNVTTPLSWYSDRPARPAL